MSSNNKNKRPLNDFPYNLECNESWHWNKLEKSHEVFLYGPNLCTAHFHPKWSNGTAGVRGTRVVNQNWYRFYWEIKVSERVFGTSMMFGICTKKARLHADSFVNMLGEDENGWGLSHKGILWHNGQWKPYTKPFRENESTTIGMLYDGNLGTLSYYKDGVYLGVAFSGLNKLQEELYPMVCSTAAKTEMTLCNMRRDFINLQDRCRDVIMKKLKNEKDVYKLCLPNKLKKYLISQSDNGNGNSKNNGTIYQRNLTPINDGHFCGKFNVKSMLQNRTPFLDF